MYSACITLKIDAMLPCICSVTDLGGHQNVVGTIKIHTSSKVSVSEIFFLPHFDIVCDLLMIRVWQHGIFLLVLCDTKNQKGMLMMSSIL